MCLFYYILRLMVSKGLQMCSFTFKLFERNIKIYVYKVRCEFYNSVIYGRVKLEVIFVFINRLIDKQDSTCLYNKILFSYKICWFIEIMKEFLY